ncbi:MAG: SCO family protein [Flavobacteriales bacterium]
MGQNKALLIRVAIFGGIALIAIYIGYRIMLPDELGVMSPSEINEELVDSTMQDIDSGHRIKDFHLVDQHGDTISREDLKGKVTVVNFFFTTCQGICPKMNSNIETVAQAFQEEPKVQFLSHTVDPSYDSVEVLKKYAERFDHTRGQWHFLTGSKKAIYGLARRSYFAVKSRSESKSVESDFIHTENVILVGPELRLRKFYSGTSEKKMDRLRKDIRILLR